MNLGVRFVRLYILLITLATCFAGRAQSAPSQAQETPSETVRTEVYDVKRDHQNQYIVRLHDPLGKRFLRIWVGPYEGQAIWRRFYNKEFPRPLTHDLFHTVLEATDIQITSILVDELRPTDPQSDGSTFFAVLNLQQDDDLRIQVDSRPSDAMALAVRMDIPIYVSRKILDENAISDGAEPAPVKRPRKGPKSFY